MEDDRVAQVQVVVMRPDPWRILLLKRSEEDGGFWQPITGGINPGEEPKAAAWRELGEETGIHEGRLVDTGYSFEFTMRCTTMTEYVFGVQAPADTEPDLSAEHTAYRWVTLDEALALLKWDNNKASVAHIHGQFAKP